jgi:murein DD-endopeptidase MepM/ murein hydrolase activator NlpD
LAERRSILGSRIARCRNILRSTFPERQILVRDQGKIYCFHLGTVHQVLLTTVVAGFALWALLATAAYFDGVAVLASKDDEIAHRTAELDGVKANYQAAFGKLDEFQTIFSSITCEVSDIQDSLLKMTEHSVSPSKHSGAVTNMPHLDPDAQGCKTVANAVPMPAVPQVDAALPRIVGALKDGVQARDSAAPDQERLRLRVAHLEEELARLKASHGAFLEQTAGIAAVRINELERALSSVGVDTKTLNRDTERRSRKSDTNGSYGRGGPFIAVKPGSSATPDTFNPVALFNTHADRLDSLTEAIKTLPLAEPLSDYDVTSPFGARNDPLNGLTGIHEGVDLGAPTGTPVAVTGDGRVVFAGWRDRYGNVIEVEHGMGVHTRYAHLSKILVSQGQVVTRGNTIGLVGETGRTTGPHLHYEVRIGDQPTNPMKFIMAGQNVLKEP